MTGGPPPPAAEDVVSCEVVVPAPPQEVFSWFVRPDLLEHPEGTLVRLVHRDLRNLKRTLEGRPHPLAATDG